jgi:hypothetical protein
MQQRFLDAARILHLVVTAEDGDGDCFDRAAGKWPSSYCTELRGVSLSDAMGAAQALDEIDDESATVRNLLHRSEAREDKVA